MLLHSGKDFAPYLLKPIFHWKSTSLDSIPTPVDFQPLVELAVANEDQRFEQGADDSEGLGVSSRLTSPLTDFEPDDNKFDTADQLPQNAAPSSGPVEKRCRNAAANARRRKKRAKMAGSGHRPHVYAANPSTAMHHAEELPPLKVPVSTEHFPASASGSWVGKHKKGTKSTPWTVPELLKEGFDIVAWDGWLGVF